MAKAGSTRGQAAGRSVGSTELIIVIPAGSYARSLEGRLGETFAQFAPPRQYHNCAR